MESLQHYEYKVFSENDETKIEAMLNTLDRLGYDVVSVSKAFLGHYLHYTVTCRKPKGETT